MVIFMKKEDVLKSCYSILRRCTPLEYDCGKICSGLCCKGADTTGMLLFPGEEALVDPDIKIVEDEYGSKVALCNGSCDRNKRPLACRIYPLFPVIKEDEKGKYIDTEFDIRANCPLKSGDYEITRRFDKAVRRVGKYLLCNEETAEFYNNLSAELCEYSELEKIFSGK